MNNRFYLKYLGVLVFFFGFLSLNAHAMYLTKDSPDDLDHKIERILVKVKIKSDVGEGNGTGFFVKSDLILTNFHVIQEAVFANGRLSLENNRFYTTNVSVVNFNIEKDLALLQVAKINESASLDILKQSQKSLVFDDYISSYGYPLGIDDPIFTNTSFAFEGLNYLHVKNTSVVLFDQLLPGMSGGPLFTETGYFAGMNSAILHEDNSLSCNLNPTTGLIISPTSVKDFLRESLKGSNMTMAVEKSKVDYNNSSFVSSTE